MLALQQLEFHSLESHKHIRDYKGICWCVFPLIFFKTYGLSVMKFKPAFTRLCCCELHTRAQAGLDLPGLPLLLSAVGITCVAVMMGTPPMISVLYEICFMFPSSSWGVSAWVLWPSPGFGTWKQNRSPVCQTQTTPHHLHYYTF